jgi:hypothetical protein
MNSHSVLGNKAYRLPNLRLIRPSWEIANGAIQ